ncbi:aromatic compound dioxygenase [Dendrothele bispora CBS 962.96]|uniref:Aromatic compound dioxygenase n=1 Tax=Dendrothele bispora (strain CBS 962.96) TaxID=1314807 RepID=A0A4V4HBQ3_DENBC|nr:aromatic compound dioxygenase [Dendrothele bispora CBS 962.96]
MNSFTCVTAPEGGEGPFYINNELVRYDLTEGQKGVQLLLDIGALDINTCEPLENIFVELWSANATGTYSSYTSKITSRPAPGKAFPLLRNETFLRGGLPTNEHGIVELKTLHPGFYWPRSPHIHVMMHSNWEESPNGTIISHAGSVVHTGQIYFEESWNDRVYSMELYNNSKNTRIRNVDDFLFKEQLEIAPEGYNPFLELELLGERIEDGLVGYMTLGVDLDASYPIKNPNYYNSSTDAKARLTPDLPVEEVSLADIDSETFLAVQVDGEIIREQAA